MIELIKNLIPEFRFIKFQLINVWVGTFTKSYTLTFYCNKTFNIKIRNKIFNIKNKIKYV